MASSIHVDNREVLIGLGQFRGDVADKDTLLRICLVLMQASIARTFREEGSPAGSWPRLAASTLKKKGYTTGHKLLILSGRLFGSIRGLIAGGVLTIGTALKYAAVHQLGSAGWHEGSDLPAAGASGRKRAKLSGELRLHQVHLRRQNIPQRMFLLFRPEDPRRLAAGVESYLAGRVARLGKLGGANA